MTTQAFNLSQFANFLNSSGQVSASGIQSGVVLPSGTVSLYYQSSAPTGWTQVTSLNDYDLRLVSSGGGTTGGTTAYSTVFANQTPTISGGVSATTLSTAQLANHNHPLNYSNNDGDVSFNVATINSFGNRAASGCSTMTYMTGSSADGTKSGPINAAGSGGSHTHGLSATLSAITLNVRYANIIICSKN
jgi:hypothetical protein